MSLMNANDVNSAVDGVASQVKKVVNATADTASQASEQLQNRVGQMTSAIGQKAQQLASSVSQASCSLKGAVSDAASNVTRRADELTSEAGVGIQNVASSLEQHAPRQGIAHVAVSAVTDSVRQTGKYLEDSKLSGAADDVVGLIRRHPIPAVLLAAGLGWYMAHQSRKA
jgi:gas vesicle protein